MNNSEILLSKRQILISSQENREIDPKMADDVIEKIILLNATDDSKEITLFINSLGGHVWSGLQICDAILNSKAPVTGIVIKDAKSMGLIILQACHRRLAYKHAEFFLHNVFLHLTGEYDTLEAELARQLDHVKRHRLQERMLEMFASKSSLEMKEIKKLCKNQSTLQTPEALVFGFIDEII